MNENSVLEQIFCRIEEYRKGQEQQPFVDYRDPRELAEILDLNAKGCPGDWNEIFRWVDLYFQYSVKTHHRSFTNRMWGGANLPSIIGDMVAAITNTSACTFESAPVSTLIERYMIDEMLKIVDFTEGEGQMTTGSSNANMIAMMCARNLIGESVKEQGLFGQKRLKAFVGADSHYSMDKAANVLGLGSASLSKVPLNPRGEMDAMALERQLQQCLDLGDIPFFVSATAGTTVRGAYDSLPPLLALRRKYKFWLHVDGAWGGAAVLSGRLKEKFLPGLGEADSFTCDFHKMPGSALMCNILLLNHSDQALARVVSAGDGSYLFREEECDEVVDLGMMSLQCGRKVDSLKWFLDWKYYGRDGFASRIERYLELCSHAEEIVVETPELELVVPRTSFNICFRFKAGEGDSNALNYAIRKRLHQKGLALVGIAYIEEMLVFRLLITNPLADEDSVRGFFKTLVATGKDLIEEGKIV